MTAPAPIASVHGRPVQILLVDDNQSDVRLTREALKDGRLINDLHVVNDGVEAMAFLRGEGIHAKAPRPDLVLLDLNMPRKDGREVLEEIKGDPALRAIPVVVLTTSSSEIDVLRSYELHANCFITKPLSFDSFSEVVQNVGNFWFSIVSLPTEVRR